MASPTAALHELMPKLRSVTRSTSRSLREAFDLRSTLTLIRASSRLLWQDVVSGTVVTELRECCDGSADSARLSMDGRPVDGTGEATTWGAGSRNDNAEETKSRGCIVGESGLDDLRTGAGELAHERGDDAPLLAAAEGMCKATTDDALLDWGTILGRGCGDRLSEDGLLRGKSPSLSSEGRRRSGPSPNG